MEASGQTCGLGGCTHVSNAVSVYTVSWDTSNGRRFSLVVRLGGLAPTHPITLKLYNCIVSLTCLIPTYVVHTELVGFAASVLMVTLCISIHGNIHAVKRTCAGFSTYLTLEILPLTLFFVIMLVFNISFTNGMLHVCK